MYQDVQERTIVALSTPVGTGGIAVIRLSGPEAIRIAQKAFVSARGKRLDQVPSHRAVFGQMQDQGEMIDEVLVLVMRGPHSFTGEDTVEINCHGGMYICQRIIEALIACGASMAEPGEFSKRAFLNGRMDLSEAEAVMDMISAQTAYSLKAAVNQLSGGFSRKVEALRQQLIDTIVAIEVNIDYPEYGDLPEITDDSIIQNCRQVLDQIDELLATAESGRMLKQGVKVAIVGQPNVGKSSLLNLLLREQRAIVTDVAGTTRDVLEERLDLGGIPLRIMDTAGIRKTDDIVEKIGVERALEAAKESDLVLLVLDAGRAVTPEELELLELVRKRPYLLVLNKTDLSENGVAPEPVTQLIGEPELERVLVSMSAKQETGVAELTDKVKELFFAGDVLTSDKPLVTNLRQKEALLRARQALQMVLASQQREQDLLVIDIRQACDALSDAQGRSTQEDVVNEIFSRFCLGK